MQDKRRPIKRKGKNPHKKLNMKTKSSKTKKSFDKMSKRSKTRATSELRPKKSLNQRIDEFKASGLTLLKGQKDEKGFKINSKFVVCIISALLVIIFVLLCVNTPTGFVEYIETSSALSKKGDSFPVSYDFNTGGDVTYSNGSALITTGTELKCYNRAGNLIYSRIHGFAEPIVKTSKVRTLIYGVNDSGYKIQNAKKEVFSKKTKNSAAIICADISDCGVYAIVTEGTEDVALVTVYDKNGDEIYKYHSANNYISGATISEDGDKLCIVSLSTKQAEFVSKISIYDLDSTDIVSEIELKNEVVYAAEYSNSQDVCVVTNKQYFNLRNDKMSKNLLYNPEFLNKFEISDDYILIYNTADANSQQGNVYVLSKTGSVKAEFEIEGNVADVSACKGKVYALSEKVNEYNFKGKLVKSTDINNGATKVSACENGVMVLYSSGIDFIKEG